MLTNCYSKSDSTDECVSYEISGADHPVGDHRGRCRRQVIRRDGDLPAESPDGYEMNSPDVRGKIVQSFWGPNEIGCDPLLTVLDDPIGHDMEPCNSSSQA
ncbi:hypothetical protein N7497_011173 [Penicillium chrysogenum]|uniref:Uncharacterized protein n=1 Tax=Penicillium chrysogenum TaxID=5076 RepID=A0ABQ8W8Z5_PENCH|nr:hypothetical protein N7505_009392 [Penicillium chrysogenum]KAJ6142074.1 hypothetical protein N7497_011173 [Penicillium chrysogenum]